MSYISRHTQAIIDLTALVKNYQYIDSLASKSDTIAVIKADAYGHDANKVAEALKGYVNLFAVGFIDEALSLRDAGITTPILILEGPFQQSDFDLAVKENFVLMIHSDYQLDWLLSSSYTADIWLKINTGMNRLGFNINDIDNVLANFLDQQEKVVLCSHFSSAEQVNHDKVLNDKPMQQLAKLNKLAKKYSCRFSMANSAGILNFPESHGDYTRLGLALYGISPVTNNTKAKELIPVMALQANIIAINTLAIGETVGYGDTWQAQRESTIATVAIGYADGYPRNGKTGTLVAINGKKAPLVGRVSMDMITVDITDILCETAVKIGDKVELWGKTISIDSVAKNSDTINYELLTRVSKRVPKIIAK